jgi:uncharacterized protein YjiS (DUF1127 family)
MHTLHHRSALVAVLIFLSCLLSRSARLTRTWAEALDAWLDRRHAAHIALEQLSVMDERELHDIGLTRSDIEWVARQPARTREPDCNN